MCPSAKEGPQRPPLGASGVSWSHSKRVSFRCFMLQQQDTADREIPLLFHYF